MSRDDDAIIAERIMGIKPRDVRVIGSNKYVRCYSSSLQDGMWSELELHNYGDPKPYTTDPAADYSVLVRVRETWDKQRQEAFADELTVMWMDRTKTHGIWWMDYTVGDWSRAALKVMEEIASG